jgi:rod shape-determining protein MreC
MEVYRRDTRGRSLLLMLVVTSLVLVTLDSGNNGLVNTLRAQAHNVISPIQSLVDDAFSPLRNVSNGITKYSAVRDENARLRRQIADLHGQQLRSRGVGSAVGQLEKLLDLPTVQGVTGIAARVTGGSPGNFDRTVQINKGSSKGIKVGYPVVTGDGLVGKVTQVSSGQATVTLIDSPTIGVGVRLETSSANAITQARAGDRQLTLGVLSDTGAKVQKGELLFTSAVTNSAFPPDEPVGKVVSSTKSVGALAPTITISTLVDLSNLDFIKVLRWPDPTATPSGG